MTRLRLSREERKKCIRSVALELIIDKGFANTSVQDIINKVGISKGGFYHYYNNKEQLFKEILEDTIEHRKVKMIDYRNSNKDMTRSELLLEILLDKILDYNNYKKMFVKLVVEMPNNPKLIELYNDLDNNLVEDFVKFCREEGFEEYIQLTNDEFGVVVSSLMMGATTFGYLNDEKLRALLKDIFSAYFEKIGLFGGENES